MSFLKTIWGFLFRLFPCPTKTGLRRIGNPGPDSPVLVACNFDLTVKRLVRILRGLDVWLLVGDSKGINVWCAAGGDEFNTHSVVSVVKTSGIADRVKHRTLILPQLAAPGVKAAEVRAQTGWKIKWGPVYAKDLPRYIGEHFKRTENMKRVKYGLIERLDTALGIVFPVYLIGGIGFWIFSPQHFAEFLLVGAMAFLIFLSLCPWLPGRNGLKKAFFLDSVLFAGLVLTEFMFIKEGNPIRFHFILALVLFPLYGLDLGGMASTMEANLEPFLAKLGVNSLGNIPISGTIRTELLIGDRTLFYDRDSCKGCRSCVEVCPQGVWEMDKSQKAALAHKEKCTACRACLVQCEGGAIQAPRVSQESTLSLTPEANA